MNVGARTRPRWLAGSRPGSGMPDLEVASVRIEHGSVAEEAVVEIEVDVLRLQHVHHPHAGDGSRELAPRLQRVVALDRDAGLELAGVRLRRGADRRALVPGPRSLGVKRPSAAELALRKRL